MRVGGPVTDEVWSGEPLDMRERLVLAPRPGRFPAETQVPGALVLAGQAVGTVEAGVNEDACCSAFTGVLMGVLVLEGKPVRTGQPVAWLRT
ncbi:hypothetical protein BH18ACT1_BH18ACT1_17450 [soil metagenome]